jgi:hypothetical protein
VTTVLTIMLDSKVSAGTRLRAAEIILTQTAKAIEIEDIDVRVAELERGARARPTGRGSVPRFSHGRTRMLYPARPQRRR